MPFMKRRRKEDSSDNKGKMLINSRRKIIGVILKSSVGNLLCRPKREVLWEQMCRRYQRRSFQGNLYNNWLCHPELTSNQYSIGRTRNDCSRWLGAARDRSVVDSLLCEYKFSGDALCWAESFDASKVFIFQCELLILLKSISPSNPQIKHWQATISWLRSFFLPERTELAR